MSRVTTKDVEQVLPILQREAREAGVLPRGKNLFLECGSRTYGRPYRLFQRAVDPAHDPNRGGLFSTFVASNLGSTAREALVVLHTAISVLSKVNDARRG